MFPSGVSLPTKACHNCRRRRWKCDRSLPCCQKCLSSKVECLGYGKLFIWNQGVASRGKMMGKSSFGESEQEKTSKSPDIRTPELREQHETDSSCPSPFTRPETCSPAPVEPQAIVSYNEPTSAGIQWSLADPAVQNLSNSSRTYLNHFAKQLCADIVAYDGPDNPMRDLLPATPSYPFLLQIIIANSALHVFNLSGTLAHASPFTGQEERVTDDQAVTVYSAPNHSFYRDALAAKQEALQLLARSITVVNNSNFDLILAAIILFINYDLVESGRDKWRVHIEGARRLISLLGKPSYKSHGISRLRTFLLSEFLVYYTLASTFRFSFSPELFPHPIQVEPILRYAETNNYLSCPGPLLSIMLESFTLSDSRVACHDLSIEQQERLKSLIDKALAFDPVSWLSTFKPASPLDDLNKRLHMASAHRSAVCIYLARFIPCTHPLLDPSSGHAIVSLTGLANDVVYHISHITPNDNLFKSVSFPLFLAGAESEDPIERAWIMNTLDRLYDMVRWGYIRTNKRTLESIWAFKETGSTCWVTDILKTGTEILIA